MSFQDRKVSRPHHENGRTVAVEEVHHIVPIKDGGARYDPENLESLCKSCHQRAH